eukprot:992397-Pelagomonas_calceolata.AAC.4
MQTKGRNPSYPAPDPLSHSLNRISHSTHFPGIRVVPSSGQLSIECSSQALPQQHRVRAQLQKKHRHECEHAAWGTDKGVADINGVGERATPKTTALPS